jgi:hypothetical protein
LKLLSANVNRIETNSNETIGKPVLSTSLFYTKWNDGGIGLKKINERYTITPRNSVVNLFLKNDTTRNLINWMLEEEMVHLGLKEDSEGIYFFNLKMKERNKINGANHKLTNEAYKAANSLGIGIKYDSSAMKIIIWDETEEIICGKGQVAKAISNILAKRHFREMESQPYRGESICTLKNSIVFNAFIRNNRSNFKDYIIRFVLRARFGTLMNPALRNIIKRDYKDMNCHCERGGYCNTTHILKGCAYHSKEIIERHDNICLRLREAIRMHHHLPDNEIIINKVIKVEKKYPELQDFQIEGTFQNFRPDIHFWKESIKNKQKIRTLTRVEISISFGKMDKDQKMDTLNIRKRQKEMKYTKYVKAIERELENRSGKDIEYEVIYKVIIISSLDPVPDFTMNNLKVILGNKAGKQLLELWGN